MPSDLLLKVIPVPSTIVPSKCPPMWCASSQTCSFKFNPMYVPSYTPPPSLKSVSQMFHPKSNYYAWCSVLKVVNLSFWKLKRIVLFKVSSTIHEIMLLVSSLFKRLFDNDLNKNGHLLYRGTRKLNKKGLVIKRVPIIITCGSSPYNIAPYLINLHNHPRQLTVSNHYTVRVF